MPKSKRNKQVDLSKAKKHGHEGKKKLYEEVRSCVESYAHVFIFSVNDMRNSKIKSVREQWRHSRFFIGKNKVMALALGLTSASEFRQNLHKIGERLKGERGLLFSNQSVEEVLKWFSTYSEGDFARSGNSATETIILKEGPLSQFPHNLEPYLRQLGLPTTLKKGIVHLIQDHTVCNAGDVLTPETAKIVKLLGYEMAEFFIKIECVWSQDGSFVDLSSNGEYKENISSLNVSAKSKEVAAGNEDEQDMEVDKSVPVIEETESKNVENGWLVENDKSVNVVEDENKTTVENLSDEDNEDSEDSDEEIIPNLVEEDNIQEKNNCLKVYEEKVAIKEKGVSQDSDNNNDLNEVSSENINEVETASLDSVQDDKTQDVKKLVKEVALKEDDVSDNSKDSKESLDSTKDVKNLVKEVALKEDAVSDYSKDSSNDIVESKESEISSDIPELISSVSSSSIDSNIIMQSPLVLDKRPKFSPRVTRSVKKAKKPTQKLVEDKNKSEICIKEDNETKEIQIDEVSEQNTVQKKLAHKRRSTVESPVELKLRNRSIKIAKNKK